MNKHPQTPDSTREQLRQQWLQQAGAAFDLYFHDYDGAACHHGFCAAMTMADVDETLKRLDAAVREMGT